MRIVSPVVTERPSLPWPQLRRPALLGVPDVSGLARSAIYHSDGRLYLERYDVVATPATTIRLHHWHASDDQRAPHDHPWSNFTTVLAGRLVEHTADGITDLAPGALVVRRADQPHRIELVTADAWTLFVTGPIVRRWGFHTDQGWVHWTDWPHAGHYEDHVAPSRQW